MPDLTSLWSATPEEQEGALTIEEVNELLDVELNVPELVASFLPGTGEVIAARDLADYGAEAKQAALEGEYGEAVSDLGMSLLAGLGVALPGYGFLKAVKAGHKLDKAAIAAKAIDRFSDELGAIKIADETADLSHAARMERAREAGFWTNRHVQDLISAHFDRIAEAKKPPEAIKEVLDEAISRAGTGNVDSVYKFIANNEDLNRRLEKAIGKPSFRWTINDHYQDYVRAKAYRHGDAWQRIAEEPVGYWQPDEWDPPLGEYGPDLLEKDPEALWDVYHGTPASDVTRLDPEFRSLSTASASGKEGEFLTNLPGDASDYARWPGEHPRAKLEGSDLAETVRIRRKLAKDIRRGEMTNRPAELLKTKRVAVAKLDEVIDRMKKTAEFQARPNVIPAHVRAADPYIVDKAGLGFGDITAKIREAKEGRLLVDEVPDGILEGAAEIYVEVMSDLNDWDVDEFSNAMRQYTENPRFWLEHDTEFRAFTADTLADTHPEYVLGGGHDAVLFFDIEDPSPAATHFVSFEPGQVKSRFAKFLNPDDPDLLASIAGPGLLAAASSEGE